MGNRSIPRSPPAAGRSRQLPIPAPAKPQPREMQTCNRWETPQLSSPVLSAGYYHGVSSFALQQLHICSAPSKLNCTIHPINLVLISQLCPDEHMGLEHHAQGSTWGCSLGIWESGQLEELGHLNQEMQQLNLCNSLPQD